MSWTIGKRLAASFASCVVGVVAVVTVFEVGLQDLRTQQDAGAKRAADAIAIQELAGEGARAYRIIADAQINLDLEKSRDAWAAMSRDVQAGIAKADGLVDTPDEQARLRKLREAYGRIASAFESRLLPALQSTRASTPETRAIDEAIDADVEIMQEEAGAIVQSLAAESADADATFDASAATTTMRASGIAALGAIGLAVMAWLVIRRLNRDLREVSANLAMVSQGLVGASGAVASSAQSLSQGATEQAASLEETSASMEEVGSMTRKNAENAHSAAALVKETEVAVQGSNAALGDLVTAMAGIRDSSGQIAKIIKTIDEIAFQTNILALNAAVEAARAGESGMGFAVVADEVRNLAQRSAQAARDTASLIEDAMSRSAAGSAKVDQMALAIDAITQKATRVRALVDDISAASQEQTQGIDQVAHAIAQMEKVTQTTAATAEESAAASEELNAQAETSMSLAGALETMVGRDERGPVAPGGPATTAFRRAAQVLHLPGNADAGRTGTNG